MKIAVLAVQGAFLEQEEMLWSLGAQTKELRKAEDLEDEYDGLVLPGGESTVQGKLLRELGMLETMKQQIKSGLPVLATCAGLILLAERISSDQAVHLGTLPVTVRRNAYGRQLGSFRTEGEVEGVGRIPMEFIRAPYVEAADEKVSVLAEVGEHIVAVRYGNQLAMAFHPELTACTKIHEYFLKLCDRSKRNPA